MARRLAGRTYAAGRWWEPEDDMPDEVAEQITNPKAWDDERKSIVELARDARTAESGYGGAKLSAPVIALGAWRDPDDRLSEEVARAITNPKAWVGGKLPTFAERDAREASSAPADDTEGRDDGPAVAPAKAVPPVKRGPGRPRNS